MAQSVEYPMWSPHKLAKVYKRYTGNQAVAVQGETIVVQNNRYVLTKRIKWVEESPKESNDEEPIGGLLVENEYLTIKTNSLLEFGVGDVIELPKDSPFAGLWIVQSGKAIDHIYTPKPLQTFQHLPLSSLG